MTDAPPCFSKQGAIIQTTGPEPAGGRREGACTGCPHRVAMGAVCGGGAWAVWPDARADWPTAETANTARRTRLRLRMSIPGEQITEPPAGEAGTKP